MCGPICALDVAPAPVADSIPPVPESLRSGPALARYVARVIETNMDTSVVAAKPTGCRFADIFVLVSVPSDMTLAMYVQRLVTYLSLDAETLFIALAFLDRITGPSRHHQHTTSATCPGGVDRVQLTVFSAHRLLLAAAVIAVKAHCDEYYPMSYYASVGGVPLSDLLAMELAFLTLIGFDVTHEAAFTVHVKRAQDATTSGGQLNRVALHASRGGAHLVAAPTNSCSPHAWDEQSMSDSTTTSAAINSAGGAVRCSGVAGPFDRRSALPTRAASQASLHDLSRDATPAAAHREAPLATRAPGAEEL